MITLLKRIIRRIRRECSRTTHYKTIIKIMLNENPCLELQGKGNFNQEVIFWGLGKVIIGENYSFGYRYGGGYKGALCEIQPRTADSVITIGRNLAANNGVMVLSAGSITIGDDCLIGQGVIIIDHDAHDVNPSERRKSIGKISPVAIAHNVWIGSKAIILPGSTIGSNCVIGAGAIVKGQFPDNVVIAGNPAKIVKQI